MAWVGGEHAAAHTAADGTMPGTATAAQIAELEAATGVEAERIFLRLMIAHHTGGIAMAQAAAAEARTPEVKTLAECDRDGPDRRGAADGADARRRAPEGAQPASARRRVTRRASTS